MKTEVIHKGDCVEILNAKIDAGAVDLIFADPPYNLSGNGMAWRGNKTGGDWHMVNASWDKMSPAAYMRFTKDWIAACKRALKKGGSLYVACSSHNIGEAIIAMKGCGLKINNVITWHKTNPMPNMTKRVFTHSSEFVVWATNGGGWRFNYEALKAINPERQKNGDAKQMRDVWSLPLVQGKERLRAADGRAAHPTQKPEELLKRIVVAGSNKGDLVLDPFLGSGTTAAVAQQLGRRWIGIEKSPEYIALAKKRMAALRGAPIAPSIPKRVALI